MSSPHTEHPAAHSLAATQKGKAIGVILSGEGTDGSLGFHAIKDRGGHHLRPGREVGQAR